VTATLLLASFAGGGAIAQAETGRTWELTSQYVIEVDHFPLEDAAIYQAQGRSALLLVDQSLGKPLLMELRVREVKPVDESAFTYGPDRRTLTMPDDFSSTVTIPYTFKGGGAIFYLGDRRVRVGTKPPLIGEATVEPVSLGPSVRG